MTHRFFGLTCLLLNVIDNTISSSYIIYIYMYNHTLLCQLDSRHLNISGSIIPLMYDMLFCLFVKIMRLMGNGHDFFSSSIFLLFHF